jgi:D-hexose-6-phosphate mutarotase
MGQTASPAPAGQPVSTGLQNPWDVRKTIADLQKDAAQLQPLLAQMSPQSWVDKKGAPTTYILQWQAAQQQLTDLLTVTNLFSHKTESLTQALDTYFRLEALETTERSLAEGAQHYDVRATTDKLNAMIAHNFTSRERLREYLRELATSTEANFRIADLEAQRCRGALSQQGLPDSNRKSRRN